MAEPLFHRLPDGRRLAYELFGDPAGAAAFYFHGGPGSRVEAVLFHDAARAVGVRVVATDRPGIGRSDPAPQRRLDEWPNDIASLADELGAARFAVFGWSEGAPSALACASVLADRVTVALDLAGGNYGAVEPRTTLQLMDGADRFGGQIALHFAPGLTAMYEMLSVMARHEPMKYMSVLRKGVNDSDRLLLDDATAQVMLASAQECFRQGSAGLVHDAVLVYRQWPFSVAQIATPVEIWQGGDDRLVPPEMNRRLAEAMPAARWCELPGEGHLFPIAHAGQICARLAQPARAHAG